MQQDAIGNVTALVSTSGTVVERYNYTSFGTVSVMDASWSARSSTQYDELYLFQGERHDWTTGNDNFDGHVYRAALQTFVSRDPDGFAAGYANFYIGLGNNPATFTDPTGREIYGANEADATQAFSQMFAAVKDLTGAEIGATTNTSSLPGTADLVQLRLRPEDQGEVQAAIAKLEAAGNPNPQLLALLKAAYSPVQVLAQTRDGQLGVGGFDLDHFVRNRLVHGLFTAMEMVPFYPVGAVGGGINTTLYALQGEYGNAAWSAVSLIPFGSLARLATGGKCIRNLGPVNWLLGLMCFTGETPLLTPGGAKPIKDFKPGDQILSARSSIRRARWK